MRSKNKSAIAVLACLLAVVTNAVADTKKIDVPPGRLTAALKALAAQSGVEFVYSTDQLEGLRTNGVHGELTVEQAVAKLLEGTKLKVTAHESGALLIAPPSSTSAAITGSLVKGEPAVRVAQSESMQKADNGKEQKAQTDPSSKQEEESGSKSIQEVIVTAQKREERLQDVPISISVLSGEALDQSTGDGVLDALGRVAGVAITPGNNIGSTISIRGIAPVFPSFFTSSPVGYYLDSVPFGFIKAAFVPDMSAYDLERVEVLRGPQGTLYGASSVGGLVRVLSKDADLDSTEFKFRSSLSDTRYGGLNYGGDAAVNVPIVEGVVAARLVAGYQDLSGWIDQPNAGRKDANDGVNETLRLKVNAQPTDALSLEFATWLSRNEDGAPSVASDSRQYLTNIDETRHSDFDMYAFDLGYDFGAFSFSSATSYLSYEFSALTDGANPPLGESIQTSIQSADVFSQELQLASTTDGPWRWTAGAIYRHVADRIFQIQRTSTGAPCCGYAAPADETNFSDSYAVFGEFTRTFADGHFELTGGLRYFYDEIYARQDSILTGAPPSGEGRKRSFDKVSPRIVASWLPIDNFTAYASYSEGFRSGADQYLSLLVVDPTLPDTQPDNLRNYEAGFKGDVLDGRLSFDAAAYYMDWQDVQSASLVYIAPNFHAATFNASAASGPGIDLSLTARPVDRLAIGTTVGWNDLTYDEAVIASFGPFGSATVFEQGDRLSLSPELTAGVWVDYTVPLASYGHELRFSASGNYTSERYQRLFGAGGPAFVNDPLTTVAARVTLETQNNWSVAVFAENLTNEQTPITGLDPTGRIDQALRMRPRTVGLQLQYRYGK